MVTQVKKNEAVSLPLYKNGPNLQFFTATFQSDISAKLGATVAGVRSPVVAALDAMAQRVSLEIVGAPRNSGTEVSFGIAAIGGDYGTDTYDGTNSQTMAAYLTALVVASGTATGTLQSVANTATTVVAGITTNL
jgi:hypothetical protein